MAAHLGDAAEGRSLMAPVHALGPEVVTFAVPPAHALGDLAMDPVDPLPYRSTTALLDELTKDAIDELSDLMVRGSDLALLQLRHGGGALSRRVDGAGARATLAGEVVLFALGVVPDPDAERGVLRSLGRVDAAAAPRRVGRYPNFVEQPAETREFFDDATWTRLQAVKAAYDPDGLFRGNHPLWRRRPH
jgi:hypothetical protein